MTASRLAAAYVFDLAAGDPEWFPHPVRLFGRLTQLGERWAARWASRPGRELAAGSVVTGAVVGIAWLLGQWRQPVWQILLAWTTLATRSLLDEAGAVIAALDEGRLAEARHLLARIVGRDTDSLDEAEIARATIETLAESACDGIVAPLFWLALGGVPSAMAYKAVNTLDSMIGHPDPPYRHFGRVAARLDDAANFIPSRLTAIGIAAAAGISGLDARRSLTIWQRDGYKHASPNAGQSEAAMAGALGVQLGGTNLYDRRPHAAPLLYAGGRTPSAADARAAAIIVATVSVIAFGVALLALVRKGR
ncbi:MAG: cobalamin biosynthesis protein CobD [Terriglobia bacterium]|nr:MAG: cobalamin biosynthesis protein CobD [Terriglobia bacterium]